MNARPRIALFAGVLLAALGAGAAIGARTSDRGHATADTTAMRTASRTASEPAVRTAPTPATPAPSPSASREPLDVAGMRRAVAALAAQGAVGAFVRPLDGSHPTAVGALRGGPAWSTIKPAIVLARYALPGAAGDVRVAQLAAAALTASDNAAAQTLFDDVAAQSGGVKAGSLAVERELRAAGDESTQVNAEATRPAFSTYGQTQWSLAAGTRFYAALARGCVAPTDADARVNAWLRAVVPDQRWGIGAIALPPGASAAFKGGWGPDPDGRYLVRQFGVVASSDGAGMAIGLMARPADGGFASGTALIDRLANAVAAHVRWRQLAPASGC